MTKIITTTNEYKQLVKKIKERIQTAQIKALLSVNTELLILYWDMAQMIVEKQKTAKWGDSLIESISKDLKKEFPDSKGFSPTNIKYIRNWYLFYADKKRPQAVDEMVISNNLLQTVENLEQMIDKPILQGIFRIPWGHNREIVTKCNNIEEALFYVYQTIEHNWSRSVLVHQMESGLFKRQIKSLNNFSLRLPKTESDLANQILKDPYCFDFTNLTQEHNERELEDGLMQQLTRFLLELGTGFSFIGRQYRLEVGGDEFFIDLLFYHVKLHCYVVVELKTVKFKPEFAGKLNFYVSAVDNELKSDLDKSTIGILICKSKNNTVVEYTLNKIDSPIGVSDYTIAKDLPEELKSSLPSIEEIETELDKNGAELV